MQNTREARLTTKTIGKAGGFIEIGTAGKPGWAKLTIPPDALGGDVKFDLTMYPAPPSPLPAHYKVTSRCFELKPHGTAFSKGVSWEIWCTKEAVQVRGNLHVMLSDKDIIDPLGWKDNQGIIDPLGWNMRGTATTVPFFNAVVMEKV